MKTLWVVGGGSEAVPGILHAKRMGLHVVVSDGNASAPGHAVADDFVLASTYDVGRTVQEALAYRHRRPIHGVIALVADVPLTVASVAKALELPGLPLDIARLGTDKLAMKRRLRELGVLTTTGLEVTSAEHLRRIVYRATHDHIAQWVVKPVDSRGARGVIRLLNDVDLDAAFSAAHIQSSSGRVLVEEWVDGPQISTETVLLPDGRTVTPGFLDRNYSRLDEFAPNVIEDGADAPTALPAEQKAKVIATVEDAVQKLKIGTPCTVKGDLVLNQWGKPVVIELALRLSGGYMSSGLVPWNTGVDLVGVAIRLALGELVTAADVTPTRDEPVCIRYEISPGCESHPQRGKHTIFTGVEAIRMRGQRVAVSVSR